MPEEKKKVPRKPATPGDLPIAPALEELVFVRKAFHDAVAQYVLNVDAEMNLVREAISGLADKKKVAVERVKELRDLLLILREVEVKPAKGRRRDLKKIEAAVKELRRIVDRWE